MGGKLISFWLIIAFICMAHGSALPLARSDGAGQSSLEDGESRPDFVESTGRRHAPDGKKSILPYLLCGAGAAAAAVVLFLVVFKAKYDVAGHWTGSETFSGKSYYRWYKFSGDRKSGMVETIDPLTFSVISTAPYEAHGKNVSWSVYFSRHSGAWDSATTMKGDIFLQGSKIGVFALAKSSKDLVAPSPPQECDILGTWIFEFNRRGSIENMTIVFSGDKSGGEFKAIDVAWMTGTFTVVDADVTFAITDEPDVYFGGRFTAENSMAGSWNYMSESWTWTALRRR
jgi:hypothetical protein